MTGRDKMSVDDFVTRLIAEGFAQLDISRIHVVQTYCEVKRRQYIDTPRTHEQDLMFARTQAYQEYCWGFYSMMRGLNAGAGVTPYRSIPSWKK